MEETIWRFILLSLLTGIVSGLIAAVGILALTMEKPRRRRGKVKREML